MKENQNIEWKSSWRDEYLKWICGFANAQGGVLEIGKNNKGKIIGISNAPKLLDELPNKIRDILGIVPDVDLINEKGKDIIRITVQPQLYPVSYKGHYHYRSGSTKQELKGAALDHFLLRKIGKHWDSVPVARVSFAELDEKSIGKFRERAAMSKRLGNEILDESDEDLIEKLRLSEGEYLKRAAVLLFHPDPESFVNGAFIKIGYFESDSELRYHDEIHGDLFTQVDRTMDLLLTKYMKAAISYEGVQRVETYPVPKSALREALLNPVAHKDYGSGVPIQISVYDDKILFWNNGRLPENWTVKTLTAKHSSQPFNPDIANAFFRAGMIEAWGRGIEKMQKDCETHGLSGPSLKYDKNGLWVEFNNLMVEETGGKPRVKTREKPRVKTREKILDLIRINPEITVKQMAEEIGITDKGIEWQIAKLKQDGVLDRIGSPKGGHWNIIEDKRKKNRS